METDRIRYFCAIVDTGSLTKAAEVLGVSHSGLSKAMAVLQDELGFKIFTPRGRGLELTEKGKELYGQGQKLLTLVSAIKAQVAVSNAIPRIGFPEVLALVAAKRLALEMRDGVVVEELDSGESEARLLARQIDFAFTFIPFPHNELEYLKITQVTLQSFCLMGQFRGHDPRQIPYVIPSLEMKENPLSLRIRDGWNPALARHTPYRANSLSLALAMVQSGACAVYIPEFLAHALNQSAGKDQQLTKLDLTNAQLAEEQTRRDVFLIKRKVDEESKVIKTAVKIIRQICRD